MYKELLKRFTEVCKKIFRENLTGVYLHGSLAMGCFNPNKSDVDLIIVVEDVISDEVKMSFMENIIRLNEEAPVKGIEMSVVQKRFCKPFVYPTPFELHFSAAHLEWFKQNPADYIEKMKGIDKDLGAHFTIINHCGIVLYGADIKEVFAKVPKQDYLDSIWFDVEGAREEIINNPMYMILNLCRVLGYLKDDLILSKQSGGEWGLKNVDAEYHDLIRKALYCYETDQNMEVSKECAIRFAEQMLMEIKECAHGQGINF